MAVTGIESKDNGSGIRRIIVGTKYPADRVALLDVVRIRRGKEHRSDVVTLALDRLLVEEGLLEAA